MSDEMPAAGESVKRLWRTVRQLREEMNALKQMQIIVQSQPNQQVQHGTFHLDQTKSKLTLW